MALLSELHSLCRNLTFYINSQSHPESKDASDPQIINFNFRIANNGRSRFLTILEELRKNSVSFGIGVREIDTDEFKTKWVHQLTGSGLESSSAIWRKEFYNHLRRATKDCKAYLEFTPPNSENEAGQINLVVVLNPGLLEKFEYAIEALSTLGASGIVKIVEQSV